MPVAVERYIDVLRRVFAGRRVILASLPLAASTRRVAALTQLGAERCFVLATGLGTGDFPDEADADHLVLDLEARDVIDEFRQVPLNIPQWRDFPLRARLESALGLPVSVDNDAKALALAEGWLGAARGEPNFLAMVVSTGVGGGIVLDGRLLDGAMANAGHIGHVIVVPGGRRCACGAHGCLEAEASGTAIAATTGRPPAEASPDVRARTGRLVGQAVASVANLLDLRLACVAGSVALGFGAAFFAAAQDELDRSARLDFSRGARIVPGGLGDTGPLVGAAALAWRAAGYPLGIGTRAGRATA